MNPLHQATFPFAKALVLNHSPHVAVPRLMYGTAWKKERTSDLVYTALKSGFRAIDTAAQPKHYQEHLVGDGIRRAIAAGIVSRKDLFLQTKFTHVNGQDPNAIPYDPALPLDQQVHASIKSSLENLATPDQEEPYLDCVLLHAPLEKLADTVTVWEALSTYVPHTIGHLGIANTTPGVLAHLLESPVLKVKPAVVQNRFYNVTGWEVWMRKLCRDRSIVFQTFWTLTGNPKLVQHAVVCELATQAGVSNVVAFYCLVMGLEGTSILDGTTNELHMMEDLSGMEKVAACAQGTQNAKDSWEKAMKAFKELIREDVRVDMGDA